MNANLRFLTSPLTLRPALCATAAGRVVDEKALRKRVFQSGIEPGLRKEAWRFLLGFYAMDATHAERAAHRASKCKEYERLKAQWTTISKEQAARCAGQTHTVRWQAMHSPQMLCLPYTTCMQDFHGQVLRFNQGCACTWLGETQWLQAKSQPKAEAGDPSQPLHCCCGRSSERP